MTAARAALRSLRSLRTARQRRAGSREAVIAAPTSSPKVCSFQLPKVCSFQLPLTDWRNAASRSYYAAYHRCILLAYNAASAEPGHSELINSLTSQRVPTLWKQVGYMLQQCKRLRERADYRTLDNFEQAEAEASLNTSQRVFEFANNT